MHWLYLSKDIFHVKKNPSRQLNVCCMKSKNIRLHFIASSFRTSMSYLYWLRAILYCSNSVSLIAILMNGLLISNRFNIIRWSSYKYVLLNLRKPVYILNMCKIQNNLYFLSEDQTRTVFWQLRNKKHWVTVWDSIYNWNLDKTIFPKQGRHGMINVWEDEVEPSSFLHCIYIWMKKLM